jgi:hypothetical protein
MFFLSLEQERLPTRQHPAWEDPMGFQALVCFHVVAEGAEVSLQSLSKRERDVAL